MKNLLGVILGVSCIGTIWAQIARRPPNYSQTNMPLTSFSCRDKILGGYYADPETDCQMFHVCVKVPGQGVQDYKFLCPNNTSFDQENQICDDWFNIDCEASTLYYSDNFDLYRIGSEFEGNRVSPGVQLPTNIVNNAVSDIGDNDYLRRSDRGDPIGSDLLRGSHSSNFFSNKNQGREDDDEVKKVPPTGKSGIRKLLTGKRPLSATTSTLPPASTSTQGVQIDTTQRLNFAGRSRGSSNFRGGFRNYNNVNKNTQTPLNNQNVPVTNNVNQNSPVANNKNYQNVPAVNNNNQNTPAANNVNQNFPTTNNYNNQNFPAVNNNNRNFPAVNNNNLPVATTNNNNFPAVNNNQNTQATYNNIRNFPNTNFNVNQQVEPQSLNTAAPTTQWANYYTTTPPTAGRQNFYPTTVAPKQNYYSTESSTQGSTFITTAGYVPKQTSFYTTAPPIPSSQRQSYFGVQGTQDTTDAKITGFGNQNHNAYYSPSTQSPTFNQNYQTTTTTPVNLQTFPTTYTPSGFSTSTRNSDQPNQQSQQINNYFETAKLYKLNIEAQNGPSADVRDKYEDSGEFLKTAPSQNLGAANFNRIQNVYKGFNTSVGASYNTGIVNATTLRPGFNYNIRKNVNGSPSGFGQQFSNGFKDSTASAYFGQSTTPKIVQNSYNGTTSNRNNYYSPAGSTQSPNQFQATQYKYYTTTTQKPSIDQNQNYQFPTGQDYTASVTTIRPTNYYSPSAPAQTNYNNQATTRNFNDQTKYAVKNEKKPSFAPTIDYSPSAQAQSSSTPFRGTALASVALPADKTEKPRPFTAISTEIPSPAPSKETKSEKDQYDYAYYDDGAHPEYDNIDAIEFSKTKSKK